MMERTQTPKVSTAAPPAHFLPAAQVHLAAPPSGILQRKCACGGSASGQGECEECRKKQQAGQTRPQGQTGRQSAAAGVANEPSSLRPTLHGGPAAPLRPPVGHHFGQIHLHPVAQEDDKAKKNKSDDDTGIVAVAQGGGGAGAGGPAAATTPDGDSLGPTKPAKTTCLGERSLIWVGGPDQNTATAATGKSRVTAKLGSPPGGGANCDCGCGLFRQFIKGFWRSGKPTNPKRFDIGSCGTPIVMNESTWTEEHEACNPGGAPVSAKCDRVYLDGPGFSAGLSDGTFVEMHLDLRYQMWDQCKGHEVATGDRRLRISGDKHPRNITFS